FVGGTGEQRLRRALEVNPDLGYMPRQALTRANKERNAGPPPVIDEKLYCGKSFRVRLGIHVGLVAIADDGLTIDGARAILATNRATGDLLDRHGANRAKDRDLLFANGISVEGDRRLHRG